MDKRAILRHRTVDSRAGDLPGSDFTILPRAVAHGSGAGRGKQRYKNSRSAETRGKRRSACSADSAPAQTKIPGGQPARDIKIETENYVAVFTTAGARLKSFQFKKYRASAGENSAPFEMIQTAPGVPLPLGVRWQTPQPFDDNGLVYSVQGGDLQLTGDAKGTLSFSRAKRRRHDYYQIIYFLRRRHIRFKSNSRSKPRIGHADSGNSITAKADHSPCLITMRRSRASSP